MEHQQSNNIIQTIFWGYVLKVVLGTPVSFHGCFLWKHHLWWKLSTTEMRRGTSRCLWPCAVLCWCYRGRCDVKWQMYTYVPRDDGLGSLGGSLQICVRKLEGREPGHGPWPRHFRLVAKNWWLEVWQIFGKTEKTKLSVMCHVLSIFLVFVEGWRHCGWILDQFPYGFHLLASLDILWFRFL